jgi:hypothetical protein
LAISSLAAAKTPTFAELFDDNGRQNRLPISFPADIGTVFVSAESAVIDNDVTCDGLSTLAMYVDSPINAAPFEVRFLHDHDADLGDVLLDERETFTLKLGASEIDRYGARVGYESRGGFQFLPVQFGPASDAVGEQDRYGEIYVHGEPTGIRYMNVFDSVCSGSSRMDGQVLVSFDMLGDDLQYFITVTSFAPTPQREVFGPYDIPEAVIQEGYGACMVSGRSGSGRVLLDGATCLAAAPVELLPIADDESAHREATRGNGRR